MGDRSLKVSRRKKKYCRRNWRPKADWEWGVWGGEAPPMEGGWKEKVKKYDRAKLSLKLNNINGFADSAQSGKRLFPNVLE